MSPEQVPMNWDEVQEVLEGLPPGIPILSENQRNNFSRYRNPPSHVHDQSKAWKKCEDTMDKYDSDLCRGYREEIDTLLVFAGLFSAVVTAFTVESYQWLQPDQADSVVSLLTQIARSVAANESAVHLSPAPAAMPRSVSIRVNAYWFLALSLSLSAALVGIMGKQWLREFERREPAESPRHAVGVRQNKFDGFRAWGVGEIISTLPLLLQISLALFATGIVELLWRLHTAVAIAVCLPASAAGLFYMATTLVPVVQYNGFWWRRSTRIADKVLLCPYRSPQALLALRAYTVVLSSFVKLASALGLSGNTTVLQRVSLDISSWGVWVHDFTVFKDEWLAYDSAPSSAFSGLAWLQKNIQNSEIMEWIWYCLWEECITGKDHRARVNIQHLSPMRLHRLDASKQPELSALVLSMLTHSEVAPEFAGEVLVQNMTSWDISSVTSLLSSFTFRSLSVSTDIMKRTLTFCHLHIDEDIEDLLERVTNLLLYPKDETEFGLRACIVYTWLDWISFHLPNRARQSCTAPRPLLLALSEIYVQSPSDEDPAIEPGGLDSLPHVHRLAALIRACYEIRHPRRQCQWPLPDDWSARFWNLEGYPQTRPIVSELLRISVCGVGQRTPDTLSSVRSWSWRFEDDNLGGAVTRIVSVDRENDTDVPPSPIMGATRVRRVPPPILAVVPYYPQAHVAR